MKKAHRIFAVILICSMLTGILCGCDEEKNESVSNVSVNTEVSETVSDRESSSEEISDEVSEEIAVEVSDSTNETSDIADETSEVADETSDEVSEEVSPPDETDYSVGLEYEVNDDGKTCTIIGIGTCVDTILNIPPEIDGYKVTIIGEDAFRYCENIKKLTIPNSVTIIGEFAFDYCSALNDVTIPVSIKSIGVRAFSDCRRLYDISFNGTSDEWDEIEINDTWNLNTPAKRVTILKENDKNSDGSIPYSEGLAYQVNDDDKTCTITGIGTCVDAILNIPPEIDGYKVTIIGEDAFRYCTNITNVIIPDSVEAIRDCAFFYSCDLESIILGKNIKTIGALAFAHCNKVSYIELPDSVTTIGERAFVNCTSLIYITMSKNLTAISPSMFQKCTSLESIYITDSVTAIGEYAFLYCDNLTSVIFADINDWYVKFDTANIGEFTEGPCDLENSSESENATAMTVSYKSIYYKKQSDD